MVFAMPPKLNWSLARGKTNMNQGEGSTESLTQYYVHLTDFINSYISIEIL